MSATRALTVRTSNGLGALPASSVLSGGVASVFFGGLAPSMRELKETSECMSGGVESFGHVGQHLAAFRGDQHIVLDSNPGQAGDIDSGLNRNHHARCQHRF